MRYDEMIREIKNERIAAAIAVAAELYLRYGISDAKMTDIAEQAQIGVASLYRYFGTKQLFTVKVGAYIWKTTMKKLEPIYKNEAYLHMSGIEQVTVLLNMFHVLMEEHRPFLHFLSEFEMFVVREHLGIAQLTEYENCSLNMLPVMTAAISRGVADGTIRSDVDATIFYYTVTDSLLSMCEKFVWGNVPNTEDAVRNKQVMNMAIEMFLSYIRR
ncbi:MAG: TetR/AcrR family transcriptional regulator [Oscillospiraceae bacterium]|nr:TetR/AcrR family transcriptional regulator [Oscillospiraceae bacterium]